MTDPNPTGTHDRRNLVKLGAAALGFGVLSACAPQAADTPVEGPAPRPRPGPDDVDVVVIGAGIAGLAAARTLTDSGYQVVVVEAAPAIGGRVRTDFSLGAPFEVGAGWIHGPDGNPITELARGIGAPTFVTDDESFQVFSATGAPVARADIDSAFDRLSAVYRQIDETLEQDQPLSRAMRQASAASAQDPIQQWMSSAYTEFDTGASLDKLSALQFDEDKTFDGADVILPRGYSQIPQSLARGLDIRLNTRVQSVSYAEGEGVTVATANGPIEASHAICTVPLGVLKAGAIAFDPPLPRPVKARLRRIGNGTVTKLALKFPTAFWPLDVQYFGLMTRQRGRWNYFLNYRTFSDENILLGVSVGDYAFTADAMSDAAMVDDAMQAIRTMFAAAPAPTGHLATHWSRDPLAMGAYSYAAVGARPDDFDALAEPIAGTVLLAGEHTTFDYHGTVHGAYLSGLKAARTIDNRLV